MMQTQFINPSSGHKDIQDVILILLSQWKLLQLKDLLLRNS